LNKKYEDADFSENFNSEAGIQYLKDVNEMWQKEYKKALINKFGKDPINNAEDWVRTMPFMDMYVSEIEYAESQTK
jgi:hypothetical protein